MPYRIFSEYKDLAFIYAMNFITYLLPEGVDLAQITEPILHIVQILLALITIGYTIYKWHRNVMEKRKERYKK